MVTTPRRMVSNFRSRSLAQRPVDVDGGQPESIGQHELTEWAFEFGFSGEPDQAEPLGQLHEEMSGALKGTAPADVDKVFHTMASSREAAQSNAAPNRG